MPKKRPIEEQLQDLDAKVRRLRTATEAKMQLHAAFDLLRDDPAGLRLLAQEVRKVLHERTPKRRGRAK